MPTPANSMNLSAGSGIVTWDGVKVMDTVTYASGIFTPGVSFGGNAVGITYLAQKGFYIRINNSVTFSIAIQLTSKGTNVKGITRGRHIS